MRPDQDHGPPGVAHDHVARIIHLDTEPTGLRCREQVEDRSPDRLVLGRAVHPGDADPLDDLPQVIPGDDIEGSRMASGTGFELGVDATSCTGMALRSGPDPYRIGPA